MPNSIKNASTKPRVFYGLHMVEGVAQYREPDKAPFTIFIGEQAIKNMDPSFQGLPVYVRHVDEVDLKNIQNEADGYVSESFYNKADGKHWVKFIVVSDKGHEAIRSGWKLSNCYIKKRATNGGLWHGVEYQEEITEGTYDHLAIVPNPRYEESVIMTPEEFKRYNGEREQQLLKLANSKEQGDKTMAFGLFKKTKVENAADYDGLVVQLPQSKKEMTLSDLVTEMDKVMNMHGYANDEHMVKVGEEEMSVKNLVKKHMAACNEMSEMMKKKENEDDDMDVDSDGVMNEDKDEEDLEESKNMEKKAKNGKKKNEADRKAEEKALADKAIADAEKAKGDENFQSLKNAPSEDDKRKNKNEMEAEDIETSEDKCARGRAKY